MDYLKENSIYLVNHFSEIIIIIRVCDTLILFVDILIRIVDILIMILLYHILVGNKNCLVISSIRCFNDK